MVVRDCTYSLTCCLKSATPIFKKEDKGTRLESEIANGRLGKRNSLEAVEESSITRLISQSFNHTLLELHLDRGRRLWCLLRRRRG